MTSLPIIAKGSLSKPLVQMAETVFSVQDFLQDVLEVAMKLPETQHILNMCSNHYNFLVTFVAALISNKISIFPHNRAQQVIESLCEHYQDILCVSDSEIEIHLGQKKQHVTAVPEVDEAQVACVFYTSGTTGPPKAFSRTWGDLVNRAKLLSGILNFDGVEKGLLATMPLQHLFGFEHAVMLTLQSDSVLLACKIFYPEDLNLAISHSKYPVVLISTPYHLKCFVRATKMYPTIEGVLCSTATLSQELANQVERRFNTSLTEIYGCTELGAIALRKTAQETVWSLLSCMSLRNHGEDFEVVNQYTHAAYVLPDKLKLQDDNSFFLVGRKEDNINVAGKRMSLEKIQKILTNIDGVEDGVVCFPSYIDNGEKAIAFVVSKLSVDKIKKALIQYLDPVFVPKHIYNVEKLSRNELGKITKVNLENLILERVKPSFEFALNSNHPSLAGHFPGNPVVPGVVIIDHVLSSYQKITPDFKLTKLLQVKFQTILKPEQVCKIEFSTHRQGKQFKITHQENPIASGVFI